MNFSGGAEARKSWVLAEITDKEYCQAKKVSNSFNTAKDFQVHKIPSEQKVQSSTIYI